MKTLKTILISVICAILWTSAACAIDITWTKTNGPYGGSISRVVTSTNESRPDMVYALAYWYGIFISTNEGNSWQKQEHNGHVGVLDIDPSDSSRVVAVIGGDIQISTDEGKTFSFLLGSHPFDSSISEIRFDPDDTNMLYVGGNTLGQAVYKVRIDAPSWDAYSSLVDVNYVYFLAKVPGKSKLLARADQLYYITSEAVGWETYTSLDRNLTSLNAYKSVIYGRRGDSLFKSLDDGDSWDFFAYSNDYWMSEADPSTIYSLYNDRIRVSYDGGITWALANEGLPNSNIANVASIAIVPGSSKEAYAATSGDGIYKIDGAGEPGASWQAHNSGLNYLSTWDIAVDPLTHYVYAGMGPIRHDINNGSDGLYRSTDNGASWHRLLNGLLSATDFRVVEIDRAENNVIYAGGGTGTGIYKSLNGGDYWSSVNNGLTNTTVTDIVIDYSTDESSSIIYAATLGDGVFRGIKGSPGSGVYMWEPLPSQGLENFNVLSLALDSTSEGHSLYAGTQNGGVFKFNLQSYNTWEVLDSSQGSGDIPDTSDVKSLAVDPSDVNLLFAGVEGSGASGCYVSTDGGGLFSRNHDWPAYDIYIDSKVVPHDIYIASTQNGLYSSNDSGSTFSPVSGYSKEASGDVVYSIAKDEPTYTFYTGAKYMGVTRGQANLAPPAPPTNLIGTAESSSAVRWSWTDNSTTEFGFRFKKLAPDSGMVVLPAETEQYLEPALTPNTLYTRETTAYNTFESAPTNIFAECTLADAPTGLYSSFLAGNYVTLDWNSGNNPSWTDYVMEAASRETPFEPILMTIEVIGAGPPQNFDGLTPNTSYSFRVFARNNDGIMAGPSNVITESTTHETLGPRIYGIRFDGMPLVNNDVIRSSPLITAFMTDEATSPEAASAISKNSIVLSFEGYYRIPGSEIDSFTFEAAAGVYELSHRLEYPLGAGSYVFTITASDELGNTGSSVPMRVRVIAGDVQVVGPTLVHPVPFKPLGEGGSARITYTLSKDADITLFMYDIGGQVVVTRKFRARSNGGRAGYNEVLWDGETDFGAVAANGIYVYKIVSEREIIGTGKLIVYD